jgi:hypothetical protein
VVIALELLTVDYATCEARISKRGAIRCEHPAGHFGSDRAHSGRSTDGRWYHWGHAGKPGYDPGTLRRMTPGSDTETTPGFEDKPPVWTRGIATMVLNADLGIYAGFLAGELTPWIWHWCPDRETWMAAGLRNHTLVETRPLTVAPAVRLDCCGTGGTIAGGRWVSS